MLQESDAQCGGSGIGETSCVLLTPLYYQYQWATCLTDEYILRTSNQRHHCRDRSAQSCWYQCQLELNNLEQGLVYENCLCSTASTLPTPDPDTPTLAPSCFSPDGIDCSWYRECLEVRYPCEGTEGGYAIEYAERYCNLFNDHSSDFTQSGRLWVDGVRKCLQVALVPSLRPWITKTCADIRSDALDSHPGCYLTPGLGAPSICNLPCSDVWRAFWVVNVIGDAFTSAPYETGVQMLRVMRGCFGTTNCIGIGVEALTFTIPGLAIYRGARLFSRAITKLSQYIARSVNLDGNGIGWFPYHDDSNNNSTSRKRREVTTPQAMDSDNAEQFVLLLVDLKLLDISNDMPTPTGNPQSLDKIITTLSDAVSSRALSQIPVTIDGTNAVFGVSSLGLCGDTFCSNNTNVTELATAAPPNGALKFALSPILILFVNIIV